MFICVCTGLDDKALEEMRKEGVNTLKKVIDNCGAGGDCGTCAFKINRYLKDGNDIDKEKININININKEIKKVD